MNTGTMLAALAVSLLTANQAQAAGSPAAPCITRPEIRGLVAYIAPTVVAKVAQDCDASLAPGGYLKRQLSVLTAALEAGKPGAWPMAKTAFFKIGNVGGKDLKAVSALPDPALQAIIDQTFTEKAKFSPDAQTCHDVEDIMATLEPLSTDGLLDFITAVLAVAARKDDKMRSCPGGS